MTPEGKVKAKVSKLLKELNIYYFMPRGTSLGRAGVPDFVCCWNGTFMGIETKAGKNKPTALQQLELARIREAGGLSFVVNEDNFPKFEEYLRGIGTWNW